MNIYQRCECHECTQARYRMYGSVGNQHLPLTTGQWSNPLQGATGGQGVMGQGLQNWGQQLRTEDEKQREIRESIQNQLSNS